MTHGIAWMLLIMAGILDVLWAVSMKLADGYTRPGWSLASLVDCRPCPVSSEMRSPDPRTSW